MFLHPDPERFLLLWDGLSDTTLTSSRRPESAQEPFPQTLLSRPCRETNQDNGITMQLRDERGETPYSIARHYHMPLQR
jgi:hypothetical protein